MGIYLNPGNKSFWEAVRSRIYVDKTNLIAYTNQMINTDEKYVCVSRPRRFGKSMTLAMLAAYYSIGCDSAELFQGRKIESDETFLEHLNRYDVIYLNMQRFLIRAKKMDMVDYLENTVIAEINKVYGSLLPQQETSLVSVLEQLYDNGDKQFIFLIDEWDCVMRERQELEEMQRQYLDFLRDLLKDQPYVALAYVTGILPVKKYGQHSALNMFLEYSMTDQKGLEEYTGFTEDEVKGLCEQCGMDFVETSSWYDGYKFKRFQHIYNPKSVVEAMRCQEFSNYWISTETYEALRIYIDMDFDGLRLDIVQMLGGGRVSVNTRSFQNDMRSFKTKDDILTLLVHLGYLGYDAGTKEVFIPNKEIIEEFENAMSVGDCIYRRSVGAARINKNRRSSESMVKGFKMKLFEGQEEEYERRHNLLWPEMKDMIHEYGGKNYTIFLDKETLTLFGYIEIEDEEKWAQGADTAINRKWWDYMADIMETNPDNSPVSVDLKTVFHLD